MIQIYRVEQPGRRLLARLACSLLISNNEMLRTYADGMHAQGVFFINDPLSAVRRDRPTKKFT